MVVLKCIKRLCSSSSGPAVDTTAFSATDYLFISTRVAKEFPDLVESHLVLSYRTPFASEEQSMKWSAEKRKKRELAESNWFGLVSSMAPTVVSTALMVIGSQDKRIQVTRDSYLFNLFLIFFTMVHLTVFILSNFCQNNY